MGRLGSWFAELKRRRVFRALVGYGIASFAVLQIIEPLMHGMHWPESVLSYVVGALAAGFPIVVTLAWIFDVNAGRIERTPAAAAPARLKGPWLALSLTGIGLLAARRASPGTSSGPAAQSRRRKHSRRPRSRSSRSSTWAATRRTNTSRTASPKS